MYGKKEANKRGFNEITEKDDEKSRIKYWERRKKCDKTMGNKRKYNKQRKQGKLKVS